MAYRVHHSDLSVTEKEEALAAWRDGTVKFMIATKGFGVGVDYPHVRFVLHLGGSSSVLDYAQETGRAGRDGEEANAQLITFPHFGRLLGHNTYPLAAQWQLPPSGDLQSPYDQRDDDDDKF